MKLATQFCCCCVNARHENDDSCLTDLKTVLSVQWHNGNAIVKALRISDCTPYLRTADLGPLTFKLNENFFLKS
jgi:hypothetical protein